MRYIPFITIGSILLNISFIMFPMKKTPDEYNRELEQMIDAKTMEVLQCRRDLNEALMAQVFKDKGK